MDEVPANTTDAGFPRAARVRAKADYARVFDQAKRTSHPLLALHWRRTETSARLGLAVSRKVDKRAVVRNRIKRTLREAFRHLRPQLAGGDYVIVARTGAAAAPSTQLADAFVQVLRRAGALPAPASDGTMPPALNSPLSPSNKPEPDAG
ncbi:MAG: ribonuclease P protein component [Pseudoxanthomonas sp.]